MVSCLCRCTYTLMILTFFAVKMSRMPSRARTLALGDVGPQNFDGTTEQGVRGRNIRVLHRTTNPQLTLLRPDTVLTDNTHADNSSSGSTTLAGNQDVAGSESFATFDQQPKPDVPAEYGVIRGERRPSAPLPPLSPLFVLLFSWMWANIFGLS